MLVASVLTGGFLVHSSSPPGSPQTYATRTGETREMALEDGSVAYLNTRTRLEWIGTGRDRRVVLHEGEAFFDVVSKATRPFYVELGESKIRVLGTRFNVYRKRTGEVIVTVVEGTVQVEGHEPHSGRLTWRRKLYANQRIEYGPAAVIRDVHAPPSVTSAASWREGILQIENQSLAQVLEELSRYTDQRIVIHDERLKRLRVLGTVSTRDVRAALARLEKLGPITVTEQGDTFTLTYRKHDRDAAGKTDLRQP